MMAEVRRKGLRDPSHGRLGETEHKSNHTSHVTPE